MGQFDSIKIGVCDVFFAPVDPSVPVTSTTALKFLPEVYLGLTKGGVELTYTPEYHDITVDQFGKTPVDAVLIGETVVTKTPLAELDMNKMQMFAHTATWNSTTRKLTFGRLPGFRLGNVAGKLRLHPLYAGKSTLEDVTIYKAVNKGNLVLNYKLEEESLLNCEFHGMIERSHTEGSYLFEIGDSGVALDALKPDLSNLEALVQAIGGDFTIAPTTIADIYGTADPTAVPPHANTTNLTCNTTYNTVNYDITAQATYTPQTSVIGGDQVLDGSTPVSVVNVSSSGVITAVDTATLLTYTHGGTNLVAGDIVTTTIKVEYASRSHVITVKVIV
jgi:hypothetical protein